MKDLLRSTVLFINRVTSAGGKFISLALHWYFIDWFHMCSWCSVPVACTWGSATAVSNCFFSFNDVRWTGLWAGGTLPQQRRVGWKWLLHGLQSLLWMSSTVKMTTHQGWVGVFECTVRSSDLLGHFLPSLLLAFLFLSFLDHSHNLFLLKGRKQNISANIILWWIEWIQKMRKKKKEKIWCITGKLWFITINRD